MVNKSFLTGIIPADFMFTQDDKCGNLKMSQIVQYSSFQKAESPFSPLQCGPDLVTDF